MYINTLVEFLLPSAELKYYRTWEFLQSNASIHGANVTKKWLKDNKIDAMDWPAKSSDLSLIKIFREFLRARYKQMGVSLSHLVA